MSNRGWGAEIKTPYSAETRAYLRWLGFNIKGPTVRQLVVRQLRQDRAESWRGRFPRRWAKRWGSAVSAEMNRRKALAFISDLGAYRYAALEPEFQRRPGRVWYMDGI